MRRLGATPSPDGTTSFRVWAPHEARAGVRLGGETHDLRPGPDGIFEGELRVQAGVDYLFVLDGDRALPDPCSRFQPDGISGPSRIVEVPAVPRRGLSLDDLVVYELHVGAFTAEGTFDTVVPHLPGLAELGVTALELMPVATFPGERGWGYDGVYAYAPHPAYGGPDGLVRLVEAADREGLGVILDVVYNHVGPGAEAIGAYGPYFHGRHGTFWGAAMDFSQSGVREWAIQNACMWVHDHGIDGLRLDAVHAIRDDSPRHVLAELADRVHDAEPHALVISETAIDDDRPLRDRGHDARWCDGLHHALHAALTGEREGYYAAFGSVEDVVSELSRTPPERYVVCAQNHEVGNRAFGDRLPADLLRVASSVVLFSSHTPLLFSSHTPLLFMGEEYGEPSPFQYAGFARDDVPDPQARATLVRSKLSRRGQAGLDDHYRRLLALRRRLPRKVQARADGDVLTMRRGDATLVVDFGANRAELDA